MRERRRDDHQAVSDMRAEFMAQWDGMLSDYSDPTHHVMVLGTTNKQDEMDKAMLRRLPRRFQVPLPAEPQRASILKTILKNEKLAKNFNFQEVARRTVGYSGSELTDLCKAGALVPLRSFLDGGEQGDLRPLTHSDVIASMATVRPANEYQDQEAEFHDAVDNQGLQQIQALSAMMQALAQQQQQSPWQQGDYHGA